MFKNIIKQFFIIGIIFYAPFAQAQGTPWQPFTKTAIDSFDLACDYRLAYNALNDRPANNTFITTNILSVADTSKGVVTSSIFYGTRFQSGAFIDPNVSLDFSGNPPLEVTASALGDMIEYNLCFPTKPIIDDLSIRKNCVGLSPTMIRVEYRCPANSTVTSVTTNNATKTVKSTKSESSF